MYAGMQKCTSGTISDLGGVWNYSFCWSYPIKCRGCTTNPTHLRSIDICRTPTTKSALDVQEEPEDGLRVVGVSFIAGDEVMEVPDVVSHARGPYLWDPTQCKLQGRWWTCATDSTSMGGKCLLHWTAWRLQYSPITQFPTAKMWTRFNWLWRLL